MAVNTIFDTQMITEPSGSYWVEDGVPNVPMFTNDIGISSGASDMYIGSGTIADDGGDLCITAGIVDNSQAGDIIFESDRMVIKSDVEIIGGGLIVDGVSLSLDAPIEALHHTKSGTRFPLPRDSNDIMVFVNGVYQTHGIDWFEVDGCVEFTAPQEGRINIRCR